MDVVLKRILECIGPKHGAGKELANFLGVHPNVITNWKAGRLKSYTKYTAQIAEFYGVSESYLLGTIDKKSAPADTGESAPELNEHEKRLRSIMEKIGKLSEKKLDILDSLLDTMLE